MGKNAIAKETDVAIIGAGGSGMAAALTLAEGGAKVIVFEKMDIIGGSSNFPEGAFAVESNMQRKEAIDITRDDAFRWTMEYSHWKANALLVRAFVDKSASTIDWLQDLGVEFIEPYAIRPGGPRTWHLIKGFGAAMIKAFEAEAAKKGIAIHYETPAKQIIREGNGPVSGVVVQDKIGKEMRVDAKAVVVASGGYANNKEWVKKYGGLDLDVNMFTVGNFNKVGDGIRMAWEVGAAEEGMGLLQNFGASVVGPSIKELGHLMVAAMQPYLWINQHGFRFCDEGIARNYIYTANCVAKQIGSFCFTIMDEDIKKDLIEKGTDVGLGTNQRVTDGLVDLDSEINEALEAGNTNILLADSLDELADKMGVDPEVFGKTVEEYNEFCAKGHDDRFAKIRKYLAPIKAPKFYAFKCYPISVGTIGGIKINERMEVLDTKENVIPGLYAVGVDAGGMYGDSYDLDTTGGTCGFAVNSGRIAGENALKYVGY